MDRPTPTAIELATIAAPIFAASGNMDRAVNQAFDLLEKCSQKLFQQDLFSEVAKNTLPTLGYDEGLRELGVKEEVLRELIGDSLEELTGWKDHADELIANHKESGFSSNDLAIYRRCKELDVSKKRREAAKRRWEK